MKHELQGEYASRVFRRPHPGARRETRHGFFIATLPEPAEQRHFCQVAQNLRRWHCPSSALRPWYNLHVTLCPLGERDSPDEKMDRALDIARRLCGAIAFPEFRARLDRVTTFDRKAPQRKAIVATGEDGVAGLAMLHAAIEDKLLPVFDVLGIRPQRAFTPHVTLLYSDTFVVEHRIAPVEWTVSRFSLIHSFIGESRYEDLGTWSLGPVP